MSQNDELEEIEAVVYRLKKDKAVMGMKFCASVVLLVFAASFMVLALATLSEVGADVLSRSPF